MTGPPADRTFMMGEFAATFPADRFYTKTHLWAAPVAEDEAPSTGGPRRTYRFGFTSYAVRLLQDVYFLDWTVDAPAELAFRQEIGAIESKKAESALYAPAAGRLTAFNPVLLNDPSGINVDKYEAGWLFTMDVDPGDLLTADDYLVHLEAVWPVTQRTIKGQMS